MESEGARDPLGSPTKEMQSKVVIVIQVGKEEAESKW